LNVMAVTEDGFVIEVGTVAGLEGVF
jgi:hypothetical protein